MLDKVKVEIALVHRLDDFVKRVCIHRLKNKCNIWLGLHDIHWAYDIGTPKL